MFIASDTTIQWWPWELTDLTAKAVGGWLLGIGATAAYAAWHNDAEDVPRAAPAYLALGGLTLLTVLRYPNDVDFGDPTAWIYLLVAITALVVGFYGTPIAWREGHLRAPMSGMVVAVLVEAGANVARGAPLMVLEAMKMEHTVAAPAAGRIAAVHFRVGDRVQEGVDLVDVDVDAQ